MFCVIMRSARHDRSEDAIHPKPVRTSVLAAPLPMSTSYEPDAESAPSPCHLTSPPARHPLVRRSMPVLVSAYFRSAPRKEYEKCEARGLQSTVARASSNPTGENAPQMVHNSKKGRECRASME